MGLADAVSRGLSSAGYAAGDLYGKQALAEQSGDIELNRAQRLAEFKVRLETELGNQQREAQVSRVNAKAGELADQEVAGKRAQVQSGIADASTWTPEMQSAVDQSMVQDKQAALADPKLRTKAAIATGDISPKDAAVLDQKSDADLTRLMLGDQRMQTMALIAAGHDETRKLVAGMMAASRKQSTDKEDRVIVHQFLQGFDRKISENGKEIRSLRTALSNEVNKDRKAELQSQITELQAANKRLGAAQLDYAKKSGIDVPSMNPDDDEPPAPPAPAPAASGASSAKPDYSKLWK